MKPHGSGITQAQVVGLVSTGGLDDTIVTSAALAAAGWAWDNQGGATLTDGPKGVSMYVPNNAGDALRQQVLAVPAAPYTLTLRLAHNGDLSNWRHFFVGWKSATGAAGKLELLTLYLAAAGMSIDRFYMTNETTYGANTLYLTPWSSRAFYFRVKESGGNIYYYYSQEGNSWYQIDTFAKGAKAPSGLGVNDYNYLVFGGNVNGGTAVPAYLDVLYYDLS